MPSLKLRFASLALLCCTAALPAMAASSATSSASSASDSLSTSVGSVSDSFGKSSDSSSKKGKVAQGDYKIIDVADAGERPGVLRLKLQALADAGEEGEFYLYLPKQTVAQADLAQGKVISANERVYGYEFAKADSREAFYLVLNDDWYSELQTKAVTL